MSGPTIGVIGGGQLGRMLHQASIGLDLTVRFLAEHADDPAAQVSPHVELGSARSADDLRRFAATCDLVTFEHELVDLAAVAALEAAATVVRPSGGVLATVADKLAMRAAVDRAGVPAPPWRAVDHDADIDGALGLGDDLVIKLARGGYDGRGVFTPDGAGAARALMSTLVADGHRLLVEPKLRLVAEGAVIACRRPHGEVVVYDPVRTVQMGGQCRQVDMPSGFGAVLDDDARRIGRHLADRLGVVGLLAVELFVVDDDAGGRRLLVNELAVRPHNSGHHTIDAAVTSQFENHLRAVADLPLGDPSSTARAATMVNIIGGRGGVDPRRRLATGLAAEPGANVHLYGKAPRLDRKLGHVTVVGTDPAETARRAWSTSEQLGGACPDLRHMLPCPNDSTM